MPAIDPDSKTQRQLLVSTAWGVFGTFGLAFATSGFSRADLWSGLLGFGCIVAGYVAHIIINRLHHTGFSAGEVALGFIAFAVSATSFALSWVSTPGFPLVNVAIGLSGFVAILAVFVFYMVAIHGVRGSIVLIDSARRS
jgi:hypothetical protein